MKKFYLIIVSMVAVLQLPLFGMEPITTQAVAPKTEDLEKSLPLPDGTVEKIDINEKETFSFRSFKKLIKEKAAEKAQFIVARVVTKVGEKDVIHYFDAQGINLHLFGENFEKNRYAEEAQETDFKNPLNRQTIKGEILYFAIDDLASSFNYAGSDKDFLNVHLGNNYFYGRGVAQDYVKAHDHFKSAADQTVNKMAKAAAEIMLGQIYLNALDVNKDYSKARDYYESAAGQTVDLQVKADADFNLGRIYFKGLDVDKNYEKALKYFESAANQTADLNVKAKAEIQLGLIYIVGVVVAPDYVKALKYYESAAAQTVNLDVKAIAENRLAAIYFYGRGVDKDYIKARGYYESAADQIVNLDLKAVAESQLGYIYFEGLGVDKDYMKARKYYESAADQTVNKMAKGAAEERLKEIDELMKESK